MKAITKVLAGGVAAAALFSAAPAAAQYYPGYGYGYNNGGIVGAIVNTVLGGGGGYGNYGYNSQTAINQCTAAVTARINRDYAYGYNPYGGYGGYGYGGGGARVLGITRVDPRSNGGLTIRGVATSGMSGGYGYNGGGDLTFKCKTDYRGFIADIDVDRTNGYYGSNYNTYDPYNPYSAYGYRRY